MDGELLPEHRFFDEMLQTMEDKRIGRGRLAEVLTRLLIASPARPSQRDIAQGVMLPVTDQLPADAVSRSTAALASMLMLTAHQPRADRPGRPYTPLQLGSARWAAIGVRVGHEGGRVINFDVVVVDLDGVPLDLPGYHTKDDTYSVPIPPGTVDVIEQLAQASAISSAWALSWLDTSPKVMFSTPRLVASLGLR
jgi:hypothetical protein